MFTADQRSSQHCMADNSKVIFTLPETLEIFSHHIVDLKSTAEQTYTSVTVLINFDTVF